MTEFRAMRRKRQQLSDEESIGILQKVTSGTLALLGDKASFCVIEQDDVQPEKYTTFFRSVITFGRIHIIEDETEKLEMARTVLADFLFYMEFAF